MNLNDLWLRLRALLFRSRVERELQDELDFHVEMSARKNRAKGAGGEEAKRRALIKFWSLPRVLEECRDERRVSLIENLFQDVRYAVRTMRRNRGFTVVAMVTLALGIGANAAIFTLIDAVLLRSLPVRDPQSLLLLGDARGQGVAVGQSGSFALFSYDLYQHLEDTNVFDALGAVQSSSSGKVSVRRPGWSAAKPAEARLVSGNYFQVLGVRPAAGRMLAAADDQVSAEPSAVVSFRYWRDALNSDPSTIGSNIDINGVPVAIAGIAPPEFYGERLEPDPPGIWLPISSERRLNPEGSLIDSPDSHWLFLLGRLGPGVSKAMAEARLTAALQGWLVAREGTTVSNLTDDERKAISESRVELNPGGSGIMITQRAYSRTLRLLLGMTGIVLLITCANVANLILARGASRRAEISLRLAIGATRLRLVRQSLTESLTLALAGGALGLLVASTGARLLVELFFRGSNYVPIPTAPDIRILLFTLLLSCAASLFFGLLPALRMGSNIATDVRGSGAGVKGSALSRRKFGLGKALIIGEVALSVVLLTGAGLFARTLANIRGQEFGFDREHVLVVSVDPMLGHYQYSRLGPLYQQMYSRLNSLSGVKSASFSYYSPFNHCCWAFSVSIQGHQQEQQENMSALLNRVSPGYFKTMGTKLLLGRVFDEHDTPGSRRVAVVNQAFVRRWLPDGNPVGRHFGIGGARNSGDVEIVGVVEDAKYDKPRREAVPMAFFALLQIKADVPLSSSTYQSNFIRAIEVRTDGDPIQIAGQVRQALAEIDPDLPVFGMEPLSEHVKSAVSQENVVAALAALSGLIALLLTCVGLYGLMAYVVQRRTSEIGVRIALGARPGTVIGMIIREVWAQALAGITIGIPAAFGASQFIASQLYGVNPADPRDCLAGAVVLTVCITVAGYLPARRASRIDAWIALRHE